MFSRQLSEGGASIVMMDMRYMWSEIDSPVVMPKRRQPSRLVVLRRSRRWRKGRGAAEEEGGGGKVGMFARAVFVRWVVSGGLGLGDGVGAQWCLPEWTDQGFSGGDAVVGVLAAASRVSLGLECAFGVGFSGGDGESGADMVSGFVVSIGGSGGGEGRVGAWLKGRYNGTVRYL